MNDERKPDGIVFYSITLRNASMLPDAELGQVVKAVWRFYDTGALPEGFDMAQGIVFDMFRQNVVDGIAKYQETCERNKLIANTRKSPNRSSRPVTSGDESLPVSPNIKENLNESEFKSETEEERKNERDHKHEKNSNPYWKESTKEWLNTFEGREHK